MNELVDRYHGGLMVNEKVAGSLFHTPFAPAAMTLKVYVPEESPEKVTDVSFLSGDQSASAPSSM